MPVNAIATKIPSPRTKFSRHQLMTAPSAVKNAQQSTLALVASGMRDAHPGVLFSQSANVYGGVGPFQFSVLSGALPAGITLTGQTSSFLLSGTPTAVGTYTFSIRVLDSLGASATQSYEIDVLASGGASNYGWVN